MFRRIVATTLALVLISVFCTATASTLPYGGSAKIDGTDLNLFSNAEWLSSSIDRASFAYFALYTVDAAYPAEEVFKNWDGSKGCLVVDFVDHIACVWQTNQKDLFTVHHDALLSGVDKLQNSEVSSYRQWASANGYKCYEVTFEEVCSYAAALAEAIKEAQ